MSEEVKPVNPTEPLIPLGSTFIFCEGGCGRAMPVNPDMWEQDAQYICAESLTNPVKPRLPIPLCQDCYQKRQQQASVPAVFGEVDEGALVFISRGREIPVPAGLLMDFAAVVAADIAPVENLLSGQHDAEPTKVLELPLYLIIALLRCLKEGDDNNG